VETTHLALALRRSAPNGSGWARSSYRQVDGRRLTYRTTTSQLSHGQWRRGGALDRCPARASRGRPLRRLRMYIPSGVAHVAVNRGATPALFVGARTDPNEQESVVMRPELDAKVP
jgi:hypothetical protein